jgi:outer membrane protein OmpA-like peptidoglycan-associated protein
MFRLPRGVGNKQSAIWKKMADAVLMNSTRHDLKERELWRRKMKENWKKMRISITRIELTILTTLLMTLIALALAPAWWGAALGQESITAQSQNSTSANRIRTIGDGQRATIEGIVIKRNSDTFTLRGSDGAETIVALTDKTTVKTVRKGLFRRDKSSGVGYILRGLRLKAEGVGNPDGQLVASSIRFDDEDLRTAQALDARVDPVETQANATQALAESNKERINSVEQNAQKLSGQIDELSAVSEATVALAANAQVTADNAQADADMANQRINGLDDYDVVDNFTIYFAPGSALLSREAKKGIDEAATRVRGENLKGWLVAVVGYADSTGRTQRNLSLSERRANAVINYLVIQHSLPPRRLVQPFGYGSQNPVATNDNSEGRSKNRRAEIRVLVNKGIAPRTDSAEKTAVVPLINQP